MKALEKNYENSKKRGKPRKLKFGKQICQSDQSGQSGQSGQSDQSGQLGWGRGWEAGDDDGNDDEDVCQRQMLEHMWKPYLKFVLVSTCFGIKKASIFVCDVFRNQ